ncbi:Putative ankyrin repeat protein L93 [Picochlorum sp. SENEW3]|nr:Putative ankyrin repeat protein L93 [Picochlorum sp. SENEW3]
MVSTTIKKRKFDRCDAVVDRIFGPGLIQSRILEHLSNVFCLKEVQACVSLHALGFLSTKDLKQHLKRHSKRGPLLPALSTFPLDRIDHWEEDGLPVRALYSSDRDDGFPLQDMIWFMEHVGATGGDVERMFQLLERGRLSEASEEFWHRYRYMEYVPMEVYKAVRAGLDAIHQMKTLFETKSGENVSNVDKSTASNHRETVLDGACQAGFDVEDISRIPDLVDQASSLCWTSGLHSASKYGHLHIVRYILETMGDVDMNAMDRNRRTAFMLACEIGRIDIVKYLCETIGNVDMNDRDQGGLTAFMIACASDEVDIVKYLHETIGSVDVNDRDHKGRTALMLACVSIFNADLAKYLYETIGNVDVNAKDHNERTALILACRNECTDAVEYLLSIGEVDVHKRDADGRTAVDYARASGATDLVDLFTE